VPLVSVVCYQAVVSATDRSFIQKSPTECDVCVCVCVCVCGLEILCSEESVVH